MNWIYIAFISAIFSAGAAVLQKKVLFNLDALEFSFVLSIFNFAIAFILIPQISFNKISLIALIVLYLKTILGALAFLNVMLAIKNMEISKALPLMTITPAIVAILSYVILGEVITILEVFGIILLLLGSYVLELKKNDKIFDPIKTVFSSSYYKYIFFALFLFSISSVIDKLIITDLKLKPISFVFFQQLFLGINFTLIVIINSKNPFEIINKISKDNLGWIILIAVCTITYRYTQIEAIKIAPVALVLAVKRTSVFFASMFGGKLFAESNLIKKGIAISIMMIGAYLLS
jgi:uncharacterized membrane protein